MPNLPPGVNVMHPAIRGVKVILVRECGSCPFCVSIPTFDGGLKMKHLCEHEKAQEEFLDPFMMPGWCPLDWAGNEGKWAEREA